MTDFVHLTLAKHASRIQRTGLGARSRNPSGVRGLYAMPILTSYMLTHQWARELRRWHSGPLVAVSFRIPDDEPVAVGHYSQQPQPLSAAQAAGLIRQARDPRGFEVFVPRAITPQEIRRIRPVRTPVGWRYKPDSHGRVPCSCPVCLASGTYGSGIVRRRFPLDPFPRPKPELMAALHAAQTEDEIVDALYELGGRRRGGAEELEYLVDHPSSEVREVLNELLVNYRGTKAKELRRRLGLDGET